MKPYLVIFALFLTVIPSKSQFQFGGFSNFNDLIVLGDVSTTNNMLRLTPAQANRRGAAWYHLKQNADTFYTIYKISITEKGGNLSEKGSDGIAFVVRADSTLALGSTGGGMGYFGIPRSIAFETPDSYKNNTDPNNNHLSIQSGGLNANNAADTYSLALTTNIPILDDGAIHIIKITYGASGFHVYIDNLETPALSHYVNLDSLIGLNSQNAFVGFTSATGNSWENHNILAWSFNDSLPPPPPPTIIMPGIMETSLYDNRDDVNHLTHSERVWVAFLSTLSSDEFLDALALDETGTQPLIAGYNIVSAPLANDADRTIKDELKWRPLKYFRSFVDYLENNNFTLDNYDDVHTVEENLFFFTYDWRLSLENMADTLSSYIDSVLKWTGASEVNIVAHSMGGLVAKEYVRIFCPSSVHKLIYVATPHLGAPKIEYTMFTGDIILPPLVDIFVDQDRLKAISRNMPSMYSLIPSADYFNTNLNNGLSFGTELYTRPMVRKLGYRFEPLDYEQAKIFLQNTPWLGASPEFNTGLINQAYEKHEDLRDVDHGAINVFNIVGSGLPTINQVKFTGGSKIKNRAITTSLLTGDGTVPLRSAEFINYTLTRANYYVQGAEHSRIFEDVDVQELMRRILTEPTDTTNFNTSTISTNPPASYLQEGAFAQVSSPVSLHAYDSFGNHTGSTGDSTWENNIPGSYYLGGELSNPHSVKTIYLPNDGNYQLIVKSLDTVASFRFQMERMVEGNLIEYAIFDSILTSNTLTAKMLIPAIIGPPNFVADYDGDSVYEITVWPNQVQLTQQLNTGWNLLSLPWAESTTTTGLYDNQTSPAYQFNSGYAIAESLSHGQGFWIKLSSNQPLTMLGEGIFSDSVNVVAGWNMVGGLSAPVVVSSILTAPDSIIASSFYSYNDGYFTADSLLPGLGYWVKINQTGKIIMRTK